MDYSVVLTVYAKENHLFFKQSIESILNQTKKTNDLIIVCDGPLTDELNEVLSEYENNETIDIVRLPKNHGSGYAAQKGLEASKNDIVARMDSDDISVPDRMEKELALIEAGYDFVSGSIAEFTDDPSKPFAIKTLPSDPKEIIRYSKKRNPFCNVTTMYRKEAVQSVGGYADQLYLEDYSLGIKIIQRGYKFTNLPDVLVNVRSKEEQIGRRGDKRVRKYLKKLRGYMLKTKYINVFEYILYDFESFVFCVSPKWLKKWFYKHILRKR